MNVYRIESLANGNEGIITFFLYDDHLRNSCMHEVRETMAYKQQRQNTNTVFNNW